MVLGDSSAAGMGADAPWQTVGAIIANGVSALRPAGAADQRRVIGAESSALDVQLANALDEVPAPDVAVVMIGANDVTHRIDKSVAVRHLAQAVRAPARRRRRGGRRHLPRPGHDRAGGPAAAAAGAAVEP